jgi:hypothetical protein
MSDDRKRDEWSALFECWADAAPSDGFADRVLAACDAGNDDRVHEEPRGAVVVAPGREHPPVLELASARLVREAAPPRSLRGSVLLIAAVAALLLIIPFALRHGERSPAQPLTVAAGPPSYDLGPTRD